MSPMRLSLAALAALAAAARSGASSKLLVNQSVEYAIYSSAGTTTVAGAPFFSFADDLNAPLFCDLFDEAGNLVWSFTNSTLNSGLTTYITDTARHCEPSASPDGAVDVFVVVANQDGVNVFGLSSASSTAAPYWTVSLPGCAENIESGTYVMMEASDSGNLVAVQCHHAGTPATARVIAIAGQTGAVSWTYDLGPGVQAGQGQVQVSTDGAWVLFVNEQGTPTPNTAEAFVISGATGLLRDNVTIPFFIAAALSDSGDYLAVGDDPAVHVWQWNGAKYAPAYDVQPPQAGSWIPWDIQISTGPDASELVAVGYISGDVRTIQVSAWTLATQQLSVAWTSYTNTQLQNNPTLRADGDFIGVSLWGDAGEASAPSVVLLQRGYNTSIFEYATPGSMMAVDVNVVSGGGGGPATVYLAAAGKHVPANQMGNGGDAFAWQITV